MSAEGIQRVLIALLAVAGAWTSGEAGAQAPTGNPIIDALELPALEFELPEVEHHEARGVPVMVLEADELPLVTIHAYFKGGYGLFGRESYASAMGLPSLLRFGGTLTLPPDSVDELLEYHAIQTSFGSAGGSVTSVLNTLTDEFDTAIELWGDMITAPRFDTAEIAVWRGSQLEGVRRRRDDPARLAFAEFNRLLFGDHPVGWEMEEADLLPERLEPERFRALHSRIVCRENLVLGVTGDAAWDDVEEAIDAFVDRVPPCSSELPESPTPDIRRGGGVYLIEKDLDQSVIVMAHPTDVRLDPTPEYYSAMIGNSILGGGGFSSRIMGRVRTEEGFAYGATSLWTTPRRHEGIVGAITRTRPENTRPAIDVILETMRELTTTPPTEDEVRTAVDRIVNGFVFNFSTPGQVVSRTMFYLAQDLPEDWLELYWRGVQDVTPGSILDTFSAHLRPDEMTILVVGSSDRIGEGAFEGLGPVTVLEGR